MELLGVFHNNQLLFYSILANIFYQLIPFSPTQFLHISTHSLLLYPLFSYTSPPTHPFSNLPINQSLIVSESNNKNRRILYYGHACKFDETIEP